MRFWISWVQRTEDYRPKYYPPHHSILGWWCSGYDTEGHAILCACVEAKDAAAASSAIIHEWPEVKELIKSGEGWRFYNRNVSEAWRPGDRFPLSDWMVERFEKRR